jgi:hypothetical protein
MGEGAAAEARARVADVLGQIRGHVSVPGVGGHAGVGVAEGFFDAGAAVTDDEGAVLWPLVAYRARRPGGRRPIASATSRIASSASFARKRTNGFPSPCHLPVPPPSFL